MRSLLITFLGSFACLPIVARARVFDMKGEKFAAYFAGQYAPSNIKKTAFENASNHSETYDGELTSLYGGEFGFIYSTSLVNLRFGLEVLRPPTLKVTASDSTGTALYALGSDVSVVIPKIGFEFNIRQWQQTRLLLNVNYGQANLGLVNTYTFTTDGTSALGKSDYTEDSRGTATCLDGGMALETLMFDSTTLAIEAGYRTLKFETMTHSRDADTLAQNAVVKGSQLLNADGTARTLDLTGGYVSLMFRFWIH